MVTGVLLCLVIGIGLVGWDVLFSDGFSVWPSGGSDAVGRVDPKDDSKNDAPPSDVEIDEDSQPATSGDDRLSEDERAMLMGGACSKAYSWSPKKAP